MLLWCAAGCPQANVIAALGLSWVDLFPAGSRERRRPGTWHGVIPVAAHGRPALESLGDDVPACMLAELGRIAYLRDRLDAKALRAMATVARACGSSTVAMRDALAAAIAGDAV